jgi:hypothetical protein
VRRAVWLSLAFGLTLAVALAQSEGVVSVKLGMGIASPGEHALVPVTLSAGPASKVGRIFLEVSFPSQFISFNSATQAAAAESLQFDIKTDLEKTDGEHVLRIELSSSSPFPQGDLIELQFDVSQEALPNQEFSLKSLEQKVETPQGEVLEARGSDGLIIVAIFGEAIPACFFYMH